MDSQRNVLIIGATSAIAEATARQLASPGTRYFLLARSAQKLALTSNDLRTRGCSVCSVTFDANDFESHAAVIDSAFQELGRIDVALIAHGDLPDQRACERSAESAAAAISTNATSVIALVALIANQMEIQRSGVIAVMGSVAGDRGRQSNYVYGAAKSMVAVFVEGLAGRMLRSGVCVLLIKPGFVDTPMTAAFKKGALWATPDSIARIIVQRISTRRSGVYYAPRFWRLIMLVIKYIPARIFYRLKL